jgi:hypothetical protein
MREHRVVLEPHISRQHAVSVDAAPMPANAGVQEGRFRRPRDDAVYKFNASFQPPMA